ncbi:MAG: DUF4314 domain-containing protein [Candidatus Methanomethylophilaceae archaeon]|jgi:hypothetical protein
MTRVSPETLTHLREKYPEGVEVELIQMDDPQAPPTGTHGKVMCVDDTGTIHVTWDTGSTLGVIYGEDSCRLCPIKDENQNTESMEAGSYYCRSNGKTKSYATTSKAGLSSHVTLQLSRRWKK